MIKNFPKLMTDNKPTIQDRQGIEPNINTKTTNKSKKTIFLDMPYSNLKIRDKERKP